MFHHRNTFTTVRILRRLLTSVALGALVVTPALTSSAASAQAFPSKPVKLVVPYPAGGFPDTVARVMAKALTEKWNQQVVIDNRPGGNGAVAAQTVKAAPADGYTLLVTDGSMFTINPALYAKLEYDAKKDFLPVSALAKAPLFLTAHPSLPANTFAEFVAYVKANPGKVNYASSGIGSTHHLTAEAMSASLGLTMVHVPFKGMGQAVPALVGGQVQVLFSALPATVGFVKDNRLKLLVQNSNKRFSGAPTIPTLAESAIPGFDFAPTTIIMAPNGTPPAVLRQLSADAAAAARSAPVAETLLNAGVEVIGSTSDELAKVLQDEAERFAKIIKTINIKAD
ncbi:MAG: tripartite tricarboxylate transporter substrate binding protein [Burkholderiales bacterium]|nr:tripartite tricarboxylate transporter substrate binding protein [Burkholderiales bacterium]